MGTRCSLSSEIGFFNPCILLRLPDRSTVGLVAENAPISDPARRNLGRSFTDRGSSMFCGFGRCAALNLDEVARESDGLPLFEHSIY